MASGNQIKPVFANALLGTTAVTAIYTSPAHYQFQLIALIACNQDTTAAVGGIDVHVDATGGAAGNGNRVIQDEALSATQTVRFPIGGIVLDGDTGGTISIKAGTGSKITYFLTGFETLKR